jgi:hypothetical protein
MNQKNRLVITAFISLVAAAALLLSASLAVAADQSASQREGIVAGSMILHAGATVTYAGDDNIYATETNMTEDMRILINPGVELTSDWNNHALTLYATGESAFFSEFTDEDYTDWTLGGSARLDAMESSYLYANGGYGAKHEERGSPDDVQGIAPNTYSQLNGVVGYRHAVSVLLLDISGAFRSLAFDENETGAGAAIDLSGRDRSVMTGKAKLGYVIDDERHAFVDFSYNGRTYEKAFDKYGYDRNSGGYRVGGGFAVDITGVTSMEIGVGYLSQTFDDARFEDVSGFGVDGHLRWTPTGLIKINLFASHTVEETSIEFASSYLSTAVGGEILHEVVPYLVLRAVGSYSHLEYQGIERIDSSTSIGIGFDYSLINNYVRIGAGYRYQSYDSDAEGQAYTRGVWTARINIGV